MLLPSWSNQRRADLRISRRSAVRHGAFTCCQDEGEKHSRRAFLSGLLNLSTAVTITSCSTARSAYAAVQKDEALAEGLTLQKSGKPVWGYVDDIGPNKWGSLSEEWSLCDTGKYQSPIEISYKTARIAGAGDLSGFERPTMVLSRRKFALKKREALPQAACKSLMIDPYVPPPPVLVGDAPPVDVVPKFPSPAVLNVPEVGRYNLLNIHFHTGGSEHVVNGIRALMEAHLVFRLQKKSDSSADSEGTADDAADPAVIPRSSVSSSFAVVAVLISKADTTSPWLKKILANSVNPSNEDVSTGGRVIDLDLEEIIPDFNSASMYTYDGSLTTPPGTEGVHWIVLENKAKVTEEDCMDLEQFQGGPNTRPLQELGDRK